MLDCQCQSVSKRVSIVLKNIKRTKSKSMFTSLSRNGLFRQFVRSFDDGTREEKEEYLSMRLVVITRAKRILVAMSSLSFPSSSSSSF